MSKEDTEKSVWERNPFAREDLTVEQLDAALRFLYPRWEDIMIGTLPYNVVERQQVVGSAFLAVGTVRKAFEMARREAARNV